MNAKWNNFIRFIHSLYNLLMLNWRESRIPKKEIRIECVLFEKSTTFNENEMLQFHMDVEEDSQKSHDTDTDIFETLTTTKKNTFNSIIANTIEVKLAYYLLYESIQIHSTMIIPSSRFRISIPNEQRANICRSSP